MDFFFSVRVVMDQYRRIKVLSHLKNKKKKNTSLHEPYLFLDKCSSGIMSVCHLDCWNVMPAPSTVWKDFGSWMQADHKMNVEIFCPQKAQAHYVYFPFKQWPYMRTDMNRTQSPDTWQLGWEGSCTVTTKKKNVSVDQAFTSVQTFPRYHQMDEVNQYSNALTFWISKTNKKLLVSSICPQS